MSARATHLKAADGIVPLATIERKQMSTKTTIKRVALVAAVALTLGGFSAVSASAAVTANVGDALAPFYVSVADSGVQTDAAANNGVANATAGAVAGTFNYVSIKAGASSDNAGSVIAVSVAGTGFGTISVPTQPVQTGANQDTLTVSGSQVTDVNGYIHGGIIKILTPTVGSFTVSVSKNVTNAATGAVTTTALQTITINVAAASVVGTYSASNSFGALIETTTATSPTGLAAVETPTVTASTASSTAAVAKGSVGSPVQQAIVAVRLLDTQATPAALAGKTVTATISGAGLLQGTGAATDTQTVTTWSVGGQSASVVASSTTDAAGWAFFNVLSSGNAGTGNISVTYTDALGVSSVVTTESITFYGDLATLKVVQNNSVIGASKASPAKTVTIQGYDAAGNVVALTPGSVTATSSAAADVATQTGTGFTANADVASYVDGIVTGASTLVSGDKFTITYSYTNGAGTVISSVPVAFTGGGTVASSIELGFDAASYAPGDIVTASLTVKDAKGNALADGTYTLFDTTTSTTVFGTSAQLTTTPFGTAYSVVKSGVVTATFYAPYTSGSFNMKATTSAASAALVTALQATTVTGQISIAGSADSALAVDAANAATDAANAAAEEASNATEAASEALAAVNSLATTVASLIAGIKAQLTSLTALIKKIQAKVKA